MPDFQKELGTDHLTDGLGSRARRGGGILLGAQAVRVGIQFAAVIVLARLLSPDIFGVIAMVAALAAVLDIVRELGLSTATIQRPDLTQSAISTMFWINVGAGAGVALLLVAGAPLVAFFYHQPILVPITRWMGLGFLLSGLSTQHWALLRRQMRFGTIAGLEAGGDILGLAIAVVLATRGAGVWSLVVQRLTPVALTFIGSWMLCRWRPGPPGSFREVREMVDFGLSVAGSSIFYSLARGTDQILIGWMWGPAALGLYERASKLLVVPINNLNIPLYTVALPAMSRLILYRDRYRAAVFGLFERLAMVTMPGAALVAVTGDWVCDLLFGRQWSAAAPIVVWFGIAAISQPVIIVTSLLYITQARPRELLRATAIDSGICVLSFLVGLPFGALGVAGCFAATGIVLRLPLSFWLSTRAGPIRFGELCATVYPALLAAVTVAVAVMSVRLAAAPLSGLASMPLGFAATIPVAVAATFACYMAVPRSRRALTGFLRISSPAAEVSKP